MNNENEKKEKKKSLLQSVEVLSTVAIPVLIGVGVFLINKQLKGLLTICEDWDVLLDDLQDNQYYNIGLSESILDSIE
jgi:hypothetical protein